MNSQSLYDKAVRSYLLTKYITAANTCNKAISAIKQDDDETLKVNIWTLYLNIASTLLVGASTLPPAKLFGLDQTAVGSVQDVCRSIWSKLAQAYQPMELMDHKLVSACLVLDLKLNQFTEAREVAESWFACLPDLVLDDIANGRQSDESYTEIVQLYTCRVLPAMNDFESAITFLEYNSILSDSKKKLLKSVIQEQRDAIEKEVIQKKKIEESAKLAAIAAEAAAAEARLKQEAAEKEAKDRQDELERTTRKEQQQRQQEQELKEKSEIIKEHTVSSSRSVDSPSVLDHNVALVKKWMAQVTTKSAASYATILIIVFALLALLRGQRGRLSVALQTLMAKLWQTIKMGTKVTYM